MRKFVLLSLAGIFLFAFIFIASMLWYRFFYASEGTREYSSVEVKLDSANNTINENMEAMELVMNRQQEL